MTREEIDILWQLSLSVEQATGHCVGDVLFECV